jgi:3-hydroxybutyryl-CoA dehydratase
MTVTDAGAGAVLSVGTEVSGSARAMTMERIGWYSIGMQAAATGELMPVQHNIHTDHEYARAQGLPAAIADGMHSTNWISAMLAERFGEHYIARGSLRTKYIKPVLADAILTPRAVITARDDLGSGGICYRMDVWCEDEHGTKLTVGDATAVVPAGADETSGSGSGS